MIKSLQCQIQEWAAWVECTKIIQITVKNLEFTSGFFYFLTSLFIYLKIISFYTLEDIVSLH